MGPIPIHDGNSNGKMGIMESSDGVHTAAVMATEKIEFFVLSVAVAVAVGTNLKNT